MLTILFYIISIWLFIGILSLILLWLFNNKDEVEVTLDDLRMILIVVSSGPIGFYYVIKELFESNKDLVIFKYRKKNGKNK